MWLAAQQQKEEASEEEQRGGGGGDGAAASAPRSSCSRLVALKLVPARRSDAARNERDAMRQLTRCAEATGPDGFAAPLLDAFRLPGDAGASALVTPAYGQSAAAVIRGLTQERGRGLPRRAVRRMARGLLGALAHLHGPHHRLAFLDLKPHNLVLELPLLQGGGDAGDARGPPPQKNKRERFRLIDFGNSSPLVRQGPWPLSSKLPDWVPAPFGWRAARLPEYASPAYEAPESVLRLPGCPAAPADLWALGCCLYEAATGWPLFRPLLVRGRLAIDDEEENDSDTGGDEDEGDGDGDGPNNGGRERRRWRLRVFSTAAEARLLSAVRVTLGPAPMRVLRRSPVWRDYYDGRGEPLDDEGTGGPPSRALARRPGSTGLRGRRLEDRLAASVGRPAGAGWGPERAAAFAAFLRPMLEFDPERRATAEAMLRHEWLLSSEEEEEDDDGERWGRAAAAEAVWGKRRPELQIEELV